MGLYFALQSKIVSSQENLQTEARQAWGDKASRVNCWLTVTVW